MGFFDKLKSELVRAASNSMAATLKDHADEIRIERRASRPEDAASEERRTPWTYVFTRKGQRLGSYNPDPHMAVESGSGVREGSVFNSALCAQIIAACVAETGRGAEDPSLEPVIVSSETGGLAAGYKARKDGGRKL